MQKKKLQEAALRYYSPLSEGIRGGEKRNPGNGTMRPELQIVQWYDW